MSEPLVDRLVRSQGWLDPVGNVLQAAVGRIYKALGRPGRVLKSFLHGSVWLGHALHPLLTDVPVGSWTAAIVLDITAHFTHQLPHLAGDVAVTVGLGGALAAAASGYTDYHETAGEERRVGTAHGLLMTLVTAMYAVSVALRWVVPSVHGVAVWISVAGYAVMTIGAYLGGHLVFDKGTMVNHDAFLEGATEYVAVGFGGDFPEGEMKRVAAAGMPVMLIRVRGTLHAIGDICTHAGGPLNEGTFSDGVVTCPWHQSRFQVTDGAVKEGPATFSQPTFAVREDGGRVEVKLLAPRHD
jgi:nitrite reductase/ring-hydroxylating ferredoxin subunit/uncharacterized membrane protein